jgi:hypothetical protein
LAVIRVPGEEEERARHRGRQREQLVRHRQKMEAQGRDLLISHGLSAPARWWRLQSWSRLGKLLPAWILSHLELYRPVLLALDQQIRTLTTELEKAAPAALPKGMGALSSVVISREICDWQRFNNRRQSPVTRAFVRANIARGQNGWPVPSQGMEMAGCAPLWSNWRGAWCAISPNITRCKSDLLS